MKKCKYVISAMVVMFVTGICFYTKRQVSKEDPFSRLVDIYANYTDSDRKRVLEFYNMTDTMDYIPLPDLHIKGKTIEEVMEIYGPPHNVEKWILDNPASRPIEGGILDDLLQDVLGNFHESVTLYSCSWEIKENIALFVDFMKDKNGVYRVICALQYNYTKILWE